jgi:GPH family glycoside/pentoside/hexuronide:cation symporter
MNVAANIFIIKMGVAVGGACIGWGLAAFGYQAGVDQQSASAIQGVLLLFSIVPSILYLLTALAIRRYSLSEEQVGWIVSELAQGRFQHEQDSAETILDSDSSHHPL